MKKKVVTFLFGIMLFALPKVALAAGYEITADCYIADYGHTVRSFTIHGVPSEAATVSAEDFVIKNDLVEAVQSTQGKEDVLSVDYKNGDLVLNVEEFRYTASDFVVAYVGAEDLNLSFVKTQVTTVNTEIADDFEALEGNSLVYRLYMPEGEGPFPLVLWTHGGGERGTDNWLQIAANRGATGWVEYNKDVIVLAPQVEQWGEDQLEEVRNIMLNLIESGKVDENRIYGSGCSFGGKGIILNAAHNIDLFTAVAPLCPSNDDEAFAAFEKLTDIKVWIYTAFEDTRPTRHIDWMSKVKQLNESGNESAAITLLLPEEYQEYGLGFASNEAELKNEYHHTWVPVMRNTHGVLDWLFDQVK